MRFVFLMLATALVGCGGKIDGGSSDGSSSGNSNACTFGEIGRVSGIPYGVASTGERVFVVATPLDEPGGASNTEGSLFEVSGSNATLLNQNISPSLVASANQIAFLQLELTANAGFVGSSIRAGSSGEDFAVVDQTNAQFVDMSSIAIDGENGLFWYRWPTFLGPGPRALPTIASRTAAGQAITTGTIDPDVTGVGEFVTDGTHVYAELTTKEDGTVIGILPVNDDPKVVLVQSGSQPLQVDAVDDTMLLYTGQGDLPGYVEYWEVPKTGGQSLFVADVPLSSAKPLLYDHDIYWLDNTNAPSFTIWKLSEIENSVAQQVVTAPGVLTMTADSCGIVYTMLDDSGQNGIVTRVAF